MIRMGPSPVEELVLLDMDRSNKGASKQRRDQINSEIGTMRDLLPLPESARQRLSQLQIMSLSCVYIRKCNVLHRLFRSTKLNKDLPNLCDFFQAMSGFMLVTTREGKLVFISENVTDYLGHSMVDMKTQGDSVYDIVDKRDHGTVQAQLMQGGAEVDVTRDVAFFCRMNMSRSLKRQAGFGDVKVMYVKGHFAVAPEQDSSTDTQYVFMAICCPLITPDLKENLIHNNTMVYKTIHKLDMTFLEVTHAAEHHLGRSNDELFRQSWYSMLHPLDINEAREKHMLLIRSNHEMGCMVIVRMLRNDNSVFWVNLVMHVKQALVANTDEPVIVCINQVISEQEAYQLKLQSQMFNFYPTRGAELWTQPLACPNMSQDLGTRWLQPSNGFQLPARLRNSQNNPQGIQVRGQSDNLLSFSEPVLRRGEHISSGSSCQTKEKLKRKIQGPCSPAKMPRLSLSDHGGNFGFASSSNDSMITNLDSFSSNSFPTQSAGSVNWSETQVLTQGYYGMPTTSLQKGMMIDHSLSPSSFMHHSQQEQVVPDMSALPESYLTPDPSPVSSPDPHYKTRTTDCIKTIKSGCPADSILEELTKLANTQQLCQVKTETEPYLPPFKPQKKILPEITATDIEHFFDLLVEGEPDNRDVCMVDDQSKPMVVCKSEPITIPPNSCRNKQNLPVIDTFELEEFFCSFNEDGLETTLLSQPTTCPPIQNSLDQPALIKGGSGLHGGAPRLTQDYLGQDYSPQSMTSSDYSDENDDFLEDITMDPIQLMTATTDDFFTPSTTPSSNVVAQEVDELYQLQKLLSSLTPVTGVPSITEETQ
ncbi:neuronal PAS domain-containing protein 4-like [Gigantopelta aegis]|uniref:neuronal PAS domain-containing protein 4-like n=1 Tax=Gigantopelta aegis TaxID=1735272 RepID=UPI001B88BA10|nr:neuronal PAS domain-containing protein 4-like [Gigantopelta aegis]